MIDPILESIAKLTTIGTVMFLPKEPISNYAQVKRVLQKAGGTYKKKTPLYLMNKQRMLWLDYSGVKR